MPTRQQLESALRNAHRAGDAESAKKLANALKSGSFDQPAAVATSEGGPEQPYYRAPDFAGQSYFDDAFASLKQEEDTLLKNWRDPEFTRKYQDIKQREQTLFEDRKKWNQGFPEELKGLKEISVEQAIAGDTPTGKRTSGKEYAGLLAMTYLAPEDKDKVAMLENAGWSVEMINGFPKVTNPKTGQEYALNKPGLSQRDVSDFLAQALQYAGVGPAVRSVTGIGKKALVGAAVSALTEGTRQGLEKALGGEFDSWPIGIAGLFGGATELAIPKLSEIWLKLSPAGREKLLASKSIEEIESLGVASGKELDELKNLIGPDEVASAPPLNRPQTTGSATDKGRLMAAARDPKIAEDMAKANSARDVWAKGRLDRAVAGEPLEDALKEARDASEEVFAQMYARRKREADKLFGNVFKGAKDVDISGLREHIKTIIDDKSIVGGEKARILGIVEKFMDTAKKEPSNPLVRRVFERKSAVKGDMLPAKLAQELKFEIDNLIGKRGMTAVGQNTESALLDVQSQLKNLIEDAAPGYKNANMAFRARTEAIDAMQEDLIGLISRKTDSNIETIGRLLDSKDVPRLLSVKGLLDQVHPRIWANVHRNWLKSKISRLPLNLMDMPNPAKTMFDKVFGSEELAKRVIDLAPDRNVKANLSWLKGYLRKSQLARGFDPAASAQALAQKEAEGGVRSTVSKLAHSTRQSIAEGIIGNGERKRLQAIFDIMEGPEWAKRMEEVRQEGLGAKATEKFNRLVDDVLRTSVQATRDDQSSDQNFDILKKTLNIK